MDDNLRYMATENLRLAIDSQGRKAAWVAIRVGCSKSLLSLAMNRQRSIGHLQAQRISELLGVPFFVLFELADASEKVSKVEAIPA